MNKGPLLLFCIEKKTEKTGSSEMGAKIAHKGNERVLTDSQSACANSKPCVVLAHQLVRVCA